MMRSSSGLTDKGIQRILELSADAHIQRHEAARDSATFHKLTGAIAAYGKVLALFAALHEREEFYSVVGQHSSPECVATL